MKTENHYTETDLGNISLNPRGEYDPEAFYEYLDTVSFDGGSYMCLAELGTKITGVPPVSGTNTDQWQILTLPGGMTPEYIAMHDDVVKKAEQVEASRAVVELAQDEVESLQADISQIHKDVQDSARSALNSKEQAAGYANAADVSKQAAERAKQDIDSQIPNIDAKLQAALSDIDTTRQNANASIKKQQELSIQAVKDQTGTYITEQKNLAKQELDQKVNSFNLDVDAIKKQVSDEGIKQVEAVQNTQTAATQAVETAKSEAIQAVQTEGTTQTGNVTAEGTKQVQAVQAAAQEIVADREQIQTNKADIADLRQNKAGAVIETVSGEMIQAEDSAVAGFEGMRIFGKSTQDGVPNPDAPIPIESVGNDGEIKCNVSGKNLFDVSKIEDTWNGTSGIINNNGILTVTSSSNDSTISTNKTLGELCPSLAEGKQYVFHAESTGNSKQIYLYNTKEMWKFGEAKTITKAHLESEVRFYADSSVNSTATIKNITVELGSVTTPYEPYHPVQQLTIPNPNGLPGIKVDSGGNYTDSTGQQWVCDEIDLERGKYVHNIYIKKYSAEDLKYTDGYEYNAYIYINDDKYIILQENNAISDVFIFDKKYKQDNTFRAVVGGIRARIDGVKSLEELKEKLKNGLTVMFVRQIPIETDLSPEVVEAYKQLHTNYPTTVITNDSDAGMEVGYVADTKNYIKNNFVPQNVYTDILNRIETLESNALKEV